VPLLGVCGWPVAHSRSPAMHEAALAEAGLPDWRYLKLPLPPGLFAETVRALPAAGFRGVNVTIPHKEAALALADAASDAAREIGAANTLTFERDGAIHAENTDAPALIAALGDRVGPVARVAYHLDGWDPAPRRLPQRAARLEGFRTTDPRTLTVVGRTGSRLVLLVVPSSTADATAEAALDAASSAGDAHSTADLLAGTGS
jgi:hypothetical protein